MTPKDCTTLRPARTGLLVKLALAATMLITATAGLAMAPATATANPCRTIWGSLPESAPPTITGHVTGVRTGRHRCFDRLVIDFDGDPSGYLVQYVPSLSADGSGANVPVRGGAILMVQAIAPAYDDNGDATADPARISATNVAGYRTFRDVEWAGSYEGYTTIGLGVRARLPFRVFLLDGPGNGSRLVIDVAHRW
jgi:hypothetical protein